jgi:lycopene beta-cyclase
MPNFDFIFAGGGAAGLSLAYHIAHSALHDCSMLIVDKDCKDRNDRTWCFWANQPTPFDSIAYRSWSRLRFMTDDVDDTIDLGAYRYKMIRGIDFYRYALREITARVRVELIRGMVLRIEDGPHGAVVWVDGQAFAGRWVFDSRFHMPEQTPHSGESTVLQQHFTGWEITTPCPAFTPEVASFLDFRTPQAGAMRFLYVLPFDADRALVEYVACTTALLNSEEHECALRAYLNTCLGIRDFNVEARECGTNPLTNRHFQRRISAHVISIGTLGGRVKPSTGYAFMRIQQDSTAIVASLLRAGHPFDVPPDPWRYRRYDSAMLKIMAQHGDRIEPIFSALFARNPIERVFRFLDERSTLWEDLRLAATLPPVVGLRAVFQ